MSDYIPALRFKFLTRVYDKLISVTFPEEKIKQALIDQLQLTGNETILDFGCGTGTLAIMIKEQFPSVNIMCVDIDKEIIGIADKKIEARKLNIAVNQYNGGDLDVFNGKRYDKIVSSFVFHHISTAKKQIVFKNLFQLTKPGGEMHIADFGRPQNLFARAAFELLQRFDGMENTKVNADGHMSAFIEESGYSHVEIRQSFNTAFGSVDLIKARKILLSS